MSSRSLQLTRAAIIITLLVSVPAPACSHVDAARCSSTLETLSFAENNGWTDSSVRFAAHAPNLGAWFTSRGVSLVFVQNTEMETGGHAPAVSVTGSSSLPGTLGAVKSQTLELRFLGTDRTVDILGLGELKATSTYLLGRDPARWRSGIRNFGRVAYRQLYPGIDLIYYGERQGLKSDFLVRPGADPARIRFTYDGADGILVDEAGDLRILTALGDIVEKRPTAHQGGTAVAVAYRIFPGDEVGFELGPYDPARSLTIDPLLGSTFLGSGSSDILRALDRDANGNVYVTGYTFSPSFPTTPGAFDETHNGLFDCVVSKFDGQLTTLLASTVIGGTSGDWGMAVEIEPDGNVLIAGHTGSGNFPVTDGAFDTSANGNTDNFILRIDADLTTLAASTYLGGNDIDNVFPASLYRDDSGNLYIAGVTHSSNYPISPGAFDADINGFGDGYVSIMNASLTTLLASTYLGGSDNEALFTPRVDSAGNVYVTGYTRSSNFPSTAGVFDESFNGQLDCVIAIFDSQLSVLRACTFIGSGQNDDASDIELAGTGDVYIVGTTDSPGFPTTPGAYDEDLNGGSDAFVARLDADLTTVEASTFLGGSSPERARVLELNGGDDLFLTGITASADFPATTGAFDESYNGGGDGFASRLDVNLTTLVASTFIGGSGNEDGDDPNSLVIALNGDVLIAGSSDAADFPTTPGAYDETYNGAEDGFVARLDPLLSRLDPASVGHGGTPQAVARLLPVRPNPSGPGSWFEFFLDSQEAVRLVVHDVHGRRVRVVAQGLMKAGHHQFAWDGRDERGAPVPPGVYFYSLEGERARQVNKMTILH